jgi:hypothetical protein
VENLILQGWVGNDPVTIEASRANGAAGIVQLVVCGYYQGTLQKYRGEWVSYLNKNSVLLAEDIQLIAELLEAS